jgi:hypothetical protein
MVKIVIMMVLFVLTLKGHDHIVLVSLMTIQLIGACLDWWAE